MRCCSEDGSSFSFAVLNFLFNTMGVPRVNFGFPPPVVKEMETILENSIYEVC
jgi:hypothetical protein